ncbi:MAG: NAD(P)H-quinone oxidoreductase, partial [Burkholderiaceae bacterium]|nr:NAD(P)H-quinone oxidoreductase [Burkholderiaceae bacterium]NDE28448.1 NAD(P)H-quinone oxidoreductase [Burkholderiaceae bacterium]
QCLPYPNGFSDVEAASLPETFFTVWSNVFQRGQLSAGETLLVQGGSSGIGVTAIMLAKAMGHRVFVTAGSDEKCAACIKLGADVAINYKTQDFVEEVKKVTNGKGVDVILDMVTGTYLQREIDCLADDGRIVVIAIMGGSKSEVNTGQILRRRLTVTGSTLRPRPVSFKRQIAKELYEHVWPLLNSGALKPVIYKTFSLEQAADAHRLMESSEHVGKIILTA